MLRVDEEAQVLGVLGLELRRGHLLRLDGLGVLGQGLGELGVAERPDLLEPRDLAVFLSGDVLEELAALHHLPHPLVAGGGCSPLSPPAGRRASRPSRSGRDRRRTGARPAPWGRGWRRKSRCRMERTYRGGAGGGSWGPTGCGRSWR